MSSSSQMNPFLPAGAVTAAVVAAGWFLLLSPAQTAQEGLQEQVSMVTAQNATVEGRLPGLKTELAGIAPQVQSLRDLSAQVPSQIDLPVLFDQLNAAAAQAGISGGVTNVTVSVPSVVTTTDGADTTTGTTTTTAPAATPAATPDATTEPGTDASGETSTSSTAAAPTSVIASYTVSMQVTGDPSQVVAFLGALASGGRLSVVKTTSVDVDDDGVATATVETLFFLQQVDVDGIATQIEALTAQVAAGTATVGPTPTDQPTVVRTPAS